jgi:hypothetical protein
VAEKRAWSPPRTKLAALRLEHENGDLFATSEAFLYCHAKRIELSRWAGDALAARLREELEDPKKRETAERKLYKKFARWATVDYYRRKNFSKDEAIRLAALAYGGKETAEAYVEGQSTIEHAYKEVHNIRHLPKRDYLLPEPEGFGENDPRDLPYGPDHLPRPDLPKGPPPPDLNTPEQKAFSALWCSYSQPLRDKIMRYLNQTGQYSAFELHKSRPELFVEPRRKR